MPIEDREFSSDEVLYWRERLEKRRKNFIEARNLLKEHGLKELSVEEAGEISRVRLHPADLATHTQEQATIDSLLEKNVKVVQEIEDAMDRLERGTFGVCLSCGDMISRSRLEALPEARLCLSCQLDEEDARRLTAKRTASVAPPSEKNKWVSHELGSLLVSDVMQEKPITVRADEKVEVVMGLMIENNIHHLPVVDKRGDIQGIISDRDVFGVTMGSQKKLANIMTKTPETVSPDVSIREAGALLLDNRISCLPVVEGNRLVGILTDKDFVKLVCQIQ